MKFLFAHARTALKFGIHHLGLRPGDAVCLPGYICNAVVEPLQDAGLEISYYPIRRNFQPDWAALERHLQTTKIRALTMVNYFGQPAAFDRFRQLANKFDLLLIEDNAHGWGGAYQGQSLGNFGDIGISSPRKNLGTNTGGLLHLNKNFDRAIKVPSLNRSSPWKQLVYSVFSRYPKSKTWLFDIMGKSENFDDIATYIERKEEEARADILSEAIFKQYDIDQLRVSRMACHRRENWRYWQVIADRYNAIPCITTLHQQAAPWAFPMLVKSAQMRDKMVSDMKKQGVLLFPWPILPEQILASSREACLLWNELVCAPLSHKPVERYE